MKTFDFIYLALSIGGSLKLKNICTNQVLFKLLKKFDSLINIKFSHFPYKIFIISIP